MPDLLGRQDPPAVSRIEPAGGGDRESPVLLVCDHASRAVPHKLGRLGLDETMLLRHIGWDIGAAEVTRGLAERLRAPAILAGYSRLVIDCNRAPGTPSSIPEVSDGIAIPGNRGLGDADRQSRVDGCFTPYHAAIAALLADFPGSAPVPAILAIHSFTPVMDGFVRPWHVGVLWDRDPRIALALLAGLGRDASLVVGDNVPYSAREPEGLTLRRHAESSGLAHVLIELRQDLVDTPSGVVRWVDRLAAVLRPILADPAVHRRTRF